MTMHDRWAIFTATACLCSSNALGVHLPSGGDRPGDGAKHPGDPQSPERTMGGLSFPNGNQPLEGSDSWITRKVEIALEARRKARARAAEVATNQGIVTLRGRVDTEAEKRLAGLAAREIEGVRNVDNQMMVVGRRDV